MGQHQSHIDGLTGVADPFSVAGFARATSRVFWSTLAGVYGVCLLGILVVGRLAAVAAGPLRRMAIRTATHVAADGRVDPVELTGLVVRVALPVAASVVLCATVLTRRFRRSATRP
jgi:hypothetical protein